MFQQAKVVITYELAPWQEQMWRDHEGWALGRRDGLIHEYGDVAHEIRVVDETGRVLSQFPTNKRRS